MSTATKEQATTMSPQEEQELKLNQSIQHYQLEDWVETIPGGFQTLRLLSDWKIAMLIFKLVMLLFVLTKAYRRLDGHAPGWFMVVTVALLALVVFAFIFGLTRKVVFDLKNNEVRVTLVESPVFRKRLHGVTALSHRYGAALYLEFNDLSRIRIMDLGPGKKLENLEQFMLEALAMKADDFEQQPDAPQEVVVQSATERLPIDPTLPALDLDTLRSAVWDDTQNHNVKNMAELLITALNDWPRDTLEIGATIKEMKAYFGEPMTVERLKSKRFDYSMPFNSWRLEAGASLWEMLELSAKLENESDFDKIVARILDYYCPRA